MVSKVIVLFLIFCLVAQADSAAKLNLLWTGQKTVACSRLVENFLLELRSFAEDLPIEIDAESTAPPVNQNTLRCLSGDTLEVTVVLLDKKPTPFLFHFQERAHSFSAQDWLEFQKAFLTPMAPPKAPEATQAPALLTSPSVQELQNKFDTFPRLPSSAPQEIEESHWYENRWLWLGIAAAVGAGAFIYWQQNSSSHLKINLAK